MTVETARAAFCQLHASGCFVIPNPWDVGTARYLQSLGFKALATTSSGFAFSHGLPDSEHTMTRDVVLRHIAEMAAATDLPLNADFQAGYASDSEGVAESVRLCVEAGVSGLSIEDMKGEGTHSLYDLPQALDRLSAARSAINETGRAVLLTARSECFLVGHPNPLKEAVKRLQTFAAAGADVLFAPGVRTREDITTLVKELHPKPVNVLITANFGLRVADLAEMGVRRVSVGSSLARVAWGAFIRAAKAIAEKGSFEGLEGAIPFPELDGFFRDDRKRCAE